MLSECEQSGPQHVLLSQEQQRKETETSCWAQPAPQLRGAAYNCSNMDIRRSHAVRYAHPQCCSPHAFIGEQLRTPSHSDMHTRKTEKLSCLRSTLCAASRASDQSVAPVQI